MKTAIKPYRTYYDSGSRWIGEIPAHWDVRQLGQLGKLSKGRGGSKEDETSEGIPCVRYGDLYTTHSFFIEKTRAFVSRESSKNYTPIFFGDVLFAASGETIDDIGKSAVNLLETNACCGGDIILFRPHSEIVARYMGYVMDCPSSTAQKATMGRGITVMHIYGNQLKRLLLPYPPLTEQTAIVRFLDHVGSRVESFVDAKERLVVLLNEERQTVIDRAVMRGLNPNTTFRATGIDWIPNVPTHWEVQRLRNVVDMRVSSVDKHVKEEEEPVRLCNYVDVYKNDYIDSQIKFMAGTATVNEIKRFRLEEGDVLITKDSESWDDIGVPALVTESASDLVSGYHLALLRPRKEVVTGNFLFRALQSNCVAHQFHVSARGVTRYGLAHADIKSICLPLPPLAEQSAISDYLDTFVSDIQVVINGAQRQIKLVREYYERLTNDVVTGKLDVREVQVDFVMDSENQNSRLSQLLADFDARGVGLNMADNLSREALYRRNASS